MFSFCGLFPFYVRAKPPTALREAVNTLRLVQILHLKATFSPQHTHTPSSRVAYAPVVDSKLLQSVDDAASIQGCVLGDLPHLFRTAGALGLLVRALS